MMLNANNSFRIGYSFKEEVIGKQPKLKLFTEQEKYRVDILSTSNEVIKDFEVNVQKKKLWISTSLLKLRLTTSLAY
jgi:hypothetical protein